MANFTRLKRNITTSIRGCGVAVAQRTFNPYSVGSNPTGLTFDQQLRSQH